MSAPPTRNAQNLCSKCNVFPYAVRQGISNTGALLPFKEDNNLLREFLFERTAPVFRYLTLLHVYVHTHRCQRGERRSGDKSHHAWQRREGDPHIALSVITIDRFSHHKEVVVREALPDAHTCTHTHNTIYAYNVVL